MGERIPAFTCMIPGMADRWYRQAVVYCLDVETFHDAMGARQRDWPDAMVTLSTHDTKRGEDVRARITVLAEEPGHWEQALDELLRLAPVPDPAFGMKVYWCMYE